MNVHKIVAYVPVTREMLDDCPEPTLTSYLAREMDRALYPWKYPDRPISFEVRLFPRSVEWLLAKMN